MPQLNFPELFILVSVVTGMVSTNWQTHLKRKKTSYTGAPVAYLYV